MPYGALYQDVMTIPGADLYWYLSHCARQGNDEMALVIMAADKAEELTSALEGATTSQQIQNILEQYDNEAYIEYFRDGTRNWENYSGDYTVPEGQYLTRFFFVAVSTGSGNNTVGNLLDDVGFTSTPRAPEADQGQLTVTKVVDGYFPDNNYSVDITVTDGESDIVGSHRLSNFTIQSDGTYAASYTFTFDNMTAHDTTQYTVSESVVGSPTDYTETSTVSVGGSDAESGTSVEATVTAGETQTVTFTNSYEVNVTVDPVEPDIRKYVNDNENGTYDLSLDATGTTVKETKKINLHSLWHQHSPAAGQGTPDGECIRRSAGDSGRHADRAGHCGAPGSHPASDPAAYRPAGQNTKKKTFPQGQVIKRR